MCVHLMVIHGGLFVTQSTRTIRVHRSTNVSHITICTCSNVHIYATTNSYLHTYGTARFELE